LYFWFENKPSGNPATHLSMLKDAISNEAAKNEVEKRFRGTHPVNLFWVCQINV
jgi:hypothetical protein